MSARGKSVSINCKFNSARGICPLSSSSLNESYAFAKRSVTLRHCMKPAPLSAPFFPPCWASSATVAVTPLGSHSASSSTSRTRNWQPRARLARGGRARVSRCTTGRATTSPNLNPNRGCAIATRRDSRLLVRSRTRGYTRISHSRKRPRSGLSSIDRANEKRSDDSSCWLAARPTIAFTARARCCDWDAARGLLGFTVSRPPSLSRARDARLVPSRSRPPRPALPVCDERWNRRSREIIFETYSFLPMHNQ